ncbi:MAG: Asp-tRNA(Asn)/Glu-tRNA(Gln) amidotransferase subunit GatC [bacterium]
MKITGDLVDKIAGLAHLDVTKKNKSLLAEQLTQIVEHMRVLDQVDVSNVEPMFHGCIETKPLRKDEVAPFEHELIMSSATVTQDNYFTVPSIIDGENE